MKTNDRRALMIGVLAAGVLAVALVGLWMRYSDFLHRGSQPPASAKILNQLEEDGVPDFSLETMDGKLLSLSDFRGKLVILNFWASWCEPCIREFPSMLRLLEKFNGRVVLLAVSADYERQDIQNFLKAFKASSSHLYVMWDKDQSVAKAYGTFTLPESYIISQDGKLIRKISGIEEWDTPDAIEYFQTLLNPKSEKSESDS